MKKILGAAFFPILLGSCSHPINFQGNISGVKSDTVLLYVSNATSGKWIHIDTLPLNNGHFETRIPDSIITNIAIVAKNQHGVNQPQVIEKSFMFFPDDRMQVYGNSPSDLRAQGTALYDLLNQETNLTEKILAVDSAYNKLEIAENADTNLIALENNLEEKQLALQIAQIQFIKAHVNSRAAAFLTLSLDGEMGLEAITLLSPDIRFGEMRELLDEHQDCCKVTAETEKNKKNIVAGHLAPNFHLKDTEGKTRSLNEFRDKYAILDFWGTWCGWCVSGIPAMKEYETKYAHKINLISIGCEDQKEKWQRCIKQNGMTWTNLFNSECDKVHITYGISSYPTKIIITPNGYIEKIFEGESQDFYDYLDKKFSE